jgi:ankyrin repeat protein
MTALHLACKNGFHDLACLLIDKTDLENLLVSSVNVLNLPMHLACKYSSSKNEPFEMVKRMIERIKYGSSSEELIKVFNRFDTYKQTVLNIAIDNNHLRIIDYILKEYNMLNIISIEDKNGNLPIHYVAKSGSVDVLKILVQNNALSFKSNSDKKNPLHIAASNNKHKFIREYLEYENNYAVNNSKYVHSVKALDNDKHSPLFQAIKSGHTKCVELLVSSNSDDIDLSAQDINGNTIYHLCAKFNNHDSLSYLLNRKEQKYLDPIYVKNGHEDTPLHLAAKHENLEIIKLISQKLYDGFTSAESYLTLKNKHGKTFFHISCAVGGYNIVEYVLKDLKMTFFVRIQDNDDNTGLHLASKHGHLHVVNLLLEYGADMNLKNKEFNNALELSCRYGYYEITKKLINQYSTINLESHSKDNPLNFACKEGAYEVVELLLAKGAAIDTLNDENKNCLDVAIENENRDVIRVLLQNKNWKKLFHTNLLDDEKLFNSSFQSKTTIYKNIENPQLNAMYEKKMWDMIKLVLDNCQIKENEYDFSILDPDFKHLNQSPLMIIAKSGQETLIKHDSIRTLLRLKWRKGPRIIFYTNVLFYLIFLILFSIYVVQLSNFDYDLNDEIFMFESNIGFHLVIMFIIFIFKNLFQILMVDHMAFFLSMDNWVEIMTFVCSFLSIVSIDLQAKLTYGSLGILLCYIGFSLLIQKFRIFGLYVLAFKRTIKNSARFFPMFLLVYIGFLLSFKLHSHLGVTFLNSTNHEYVVRSLAMMIGELNTGEMGLGQGFFINYVMYTLFICLMCVIILNLFIGIAVGEISTVLNEADVMQLSMRIVFALKCQSSSKPFRDWPLLRNILNIRRDRYDSKKGGFFMKSKKFLHQMIDKIFKSRTPEIKLADPNKRIEDNLTELAKQTSNDFKSFKEVINNKINDLKTMIKSSQQKLEDSLIDSGLKQANNAENTREDAFGQLKDVENSIINSNKQIQFVVDDSFGKTNNLLIGFKQLLGNRINKMEESIASPIKFIETNVNQLFDRTDQMTKTTNEEFKHLNKSLMCMINQINDMQGQILKINQEFSLFIKVCKPCLDVNNVATINAAGVAINLNENLSKRLSSAEYSVITKSQTSEEITNGNSRLKVTKEQHTENKLNILKK